MTTNKLQKNLIIGCSFSPETIQDIFKNQGKEITQEKAIEFIEDHCDNDTLSNDANDILADLIKEEIEEMDKKKGKKQLKITI